jgi:hypothetical protein
LDAVWVRFGPGPGRLDGHHRDAFDTEFRFGPNDIAGLGAAIEQGGIEGASGFESACSPPGPSAIGPRTCQLYVYAASHRTKVQLPGGSANHGFATSQNAILSL